MESSTVPVNRPQAEQANDSKCNVLTELHINVQWFLSYLHDAVRDVQAQGANAEPGQSSTKAEALGLPAQAEQQQLASGPSSGAPGFHAELVANYVRFEQLLQAVPEEIRCWSTARIESELQTLQQEDTKTAEEVKVLTARAEELKQCLASEIQTACQELCNDAVTVVRSNKSGKTGAEEPAPQSTVNRHPCSLRARLQDLRQDNSRRFIEELEFVQCLANPEYVQWLATQQYLEDQAFLNFLDYLQYWRKWPYVQHIMYPQAMRMLEMLQDPGVRSRLHRLDTRELLTTQMLWKWATPSEFVLEVPQDQKEESTKPAHTGVSSSQKKTNGAALSGQCLDVLRDWTRLEGVLADKTWHEKVEAIDASLYSIQHDAALIGRLYLRRAYKGPQLEEAVKKYRHLWGSDAGSCDLSVSFGAVRDTPKTPSVSEGLLSAALHQLCPRPARLRVGHHYSSGGRAIDVEATSIPRVVIDDGPPVSSQEMPRKRARR